MTRPTTDGEQPGDADDDLDDPMLRMVAAAPSISLGDAFLVALRGVLHTVRFDDGGCSNDAVVGPVRLDAVAEGSVDETDADAAVDPHDPPTRGR